MDLYCARCLYMHTDRETQNQNNTGSKHFIISTLVDKPVYVHIRHF